MYMSFLFDKNIKKTSGPEIIVAESSLQIKSQQLKLDLQIF